MVCLSSAVLLMIYGVTNRLTQLDYTDGVLARKTDRPALPLGTITHFQSEQEQNGQQVHHGPQQMWSYQRLVVENSELCTIKTLGES